MHCSDVHVHAGWAGSKRGGAASYSMHAACLCAEVHNTDIIIIDNKINNNGNSDRVMIIIRNMCS